MVSGRKFPFGQFYLEKVEQINYLHRNVIMTSLNMKAYTRLTEDLQSLYGLMTVLIVTPYYACVCWHSWKSCRTEAKTNVCAQFRAALCRRCGWAWKGKAYLLGPTRTLVLPEKVVSSGINQSSFRGCCEVWLGWWRTIAREQNLSCPQPVLQQALSVKVRWRLVSVVVTVLFCLKKNNKRPWGDLATS